MLSQRFGRGLHQVINVLFPLELYGQELYFCFGS